MTMKNETLKYVRKLITLHQVDVLNPYGKIQKNVCNEFSKEISQDCRQQSKNEWYENVTINSLIYTLTKS